MFKQRTKKPAPPQRHAPRPVGKMRTKGWARPQRRRTPWPPPAFAM